MGKTLIPKSFKADIKRALHNLYQEKGTTLHPMTLIPIYYRRMFKGDTMDFGILESILRSEPTFAPLFSNWRLRFEWYFDSDANRYGWVDNNTRLSAEEVMDRKHHACLLPHYTSSDLGSEPYGDIGVFRGGVHDYAGVAPGYLFVDAGLTDYGSMINVDFHLTYLNIIRNYHVNKQFPKIPYISSAAPGSGSQSPQALNFSSYDLSDLDNLFMFLRSCPNGVLFQAGAGVDIPEYDGLSCDAPSDLYNYYSRAVETFNTYLTYCKYHHGGIFCSQYEPDLYQNILAKDNGLLRSTVTVRDGGILIEEFRLSNHLQGLYDKIFVSGGTDRELSRTIWGIESNRDYDIPELLCTHSEIIGTNLVTSSTAGETDYNGDGDIVKNVPGSMAGNINERRGSGRIQKFTARTSGSLMCIVSLVPLVSYSENIERHLLERNFMDEFTPDMAQKGFEDVPLSDYCALPLPSGVNFASYDTVQYPMNTSVGKQVAWLREMTAVNRVHGEFSNGGEKSDWFLIRKYLRKYTNGGLQRASYEITPYGNPLDYQYPFVAQSLLDPNFSLQVGIYNKAYRPVPRRFMPTLGN